jgi:hypothetical protein
MNEKANIGSIFGTALFGVVSDLTKAKENGQQLPGVLDNIASLALNAKNQGIDFVKEEAKQQTIKALPWFGLSIAIIIILILAFKK